MYMHVKEEYLSRILGDKAAEHYRQHGWTFGPRLKEENGISVPTKVFLLICRGWVGCYLHGYVAPPHELSEQGMQAELFALLQRAQAQGKEMDEVTVGVLWTLAQQTFPM
jgi:hypothetical protein